MAESQAAARSAPLPTISQIKSVTVGEVTHTRTPGHQNHSLHDYTPSLSFSISPSQHMKLPVFTVREAAFDKEAHLKPVTRSTKALKNKPMEYS